MFKIEMLPAGHGDSLWIEYGEPGAIHRVLIDGGTAATYDSLRERIERIPEDERRLDLLIVTHVDADHIEGSVRLLGDKALKLKCDDVWFNGFKHLPNPDDDRLGPVQGEYLSALIRKRRHPWNRAFKGKAAMIPDEGPIRSYTLTGGMKLTLLSPTERQLTRLRPQWNKVVREAGLEPGVAKEALEALAKDKKLQPDALGEPRIKVEALAASDFRADAALANGSTIAVLAEYGGKRALLGGDAFAPVLQQSIQRLLDAGGLDRLALNAFKVPHHGSKGNLSTDVLDLIKCKRYLFSTNGKLFNHPDAEGVARVIIHGGKEPGLFFNYRTEDNEVWDNEKLIKKHKYTVTYPEEGKEGLVVEL
jgi:beta-lactamase superfamily II metal-dependent hydrolase